MTYDVPLGGYGDKVASHMFAEIQVPPGKTAVWTMDCQHNSEKSFEFYVNPRPIHELLKESGITSFKLYEKKEITLPAPKFRVMPKPVPVHEKVEKQE